MRAGRAAGSGSPRPLPPRSGRRREEGEAGGDETAFVDPDVALSYIESCGPSDMPAVSSSPVEFVAVSMLVW